MCRDRHNRRVWSLSELISLPWDDDTGGECQAYLSISPHTTHASSDRPLLFQYGNYLLVTLPVRQVSNTQ
ncbi:hypothetical protein J6590_049296 [Homalodisca vitripennis]|nr:hypothetical protein J6590_049296 [Homalodisca vitripennis]